MSRNRGGVLVGALTWLLLSHAAAAQQPACPLPGQQPAMVVQMFFGQSVPGRGPVTHEEWASFLADVVTTRFPDGLTVYDAYGQWRDSQTNAIGREDTKVVVIATEDTPQVRTRIGEASAIYRERFRQQSVGIVTNPGCAAF